MSRPVALITGAAGTLAGKVARDLAVDHDILGIDTRPPRAGVRFPGRYSQVRHYAQRQIAELFRTHRPSVVVHFGALPSQVRDPNRRFTDNVLGTRNLFEQAIKVGTQRMVVQSTFHVYGAVHSNHVHIMEDEPLRASQTFPEISDVVEMDHAATTFLWKHREVQTVVLRMANMVGPQLRNFISRTLRRQRVPRLWGYDPVMQFLHEDDAVHAFTLAARSGGWGVYNVAGEGAVSWSWAIRHAGAQYVSVPHLLAIPAMELLFRARGATLPAHLIDFFRYPVIIDDTRFREDFGYRERYSTIDALKSVRGLA